MRQPVETGRRENPLAPERLERVLLVGTRLRGRHYGQRSCVPHQQVEHMGRTDQAQQNVRSTLANGEPSTHGALLTVPRWSSWVPRFSAFGLRRNVHCAADAMVSVASSRTQDQ